MSHEAYVARSERREQDPFFLGTDNHMLRVHLDLSHDDVGLHLADVHAVDTAQRLGDGSCGLVILQDALAVVLDRKQRSSSHNPRLAHAAAEHFAKTQGSLDGGVVTANSRAYRRAKTFGETHADRVTGGAQLRDRPTCCHCCIPNACAIEMQPQAFFARQRRNRFHILLREHSSARHIVGVLDHHQARVGAVVSTRLDGCPNLLGAEKSFLPYVLKLNA